MRTSTFPALLTLAALAAGCADQAPSPTDSLEATVSVSFSRADPTNAHTHLSGDEEVPARDTQAQGQLKLKLSGDGSSIAYKLIATNIDNIQQAHLHLAPAEVNGPIVAWLYPAAPPAQLIPGRHTGILAEGEITVLVGPMAGQDIADLWEQIQAGNVYGNVHTVQFPGGEIRGQVRTGG
jgi:hypothetical protein